MLNELFPLISGSKAKDLLRRLEKNKIEQALPAEMELALLWALQGAGPVEVEPDWFSANTRPEAYSEHLFPGWPTIIEVAALSDASLPGDEGMRNAVGKLRALAGSLRKGAAKHISFFFHEESFYKNGQYTRRIKVPRCLTVDPALASRLGEWLQAVPPPGATLPLRTDQLDVVLTWHVEEQHRYAFCSSMPPEVHDLRDNHLWRVLAGKSHQLKSETFGGGRCLFIADTGSTLLRQLQDVDHTGRRISGSQIIASFLSQNAPGLDVIVVFSPKRERQLFWGRSTLQWAVTWFARDAFRELDVSNLNSLAKKLPAPRFEGYQARKLHEQGLYTPTGRPWRLATIFISEGGKLTIKVSSRVLLQVMAGISTASELLDERSGANILLNQIKLGRTIRSIKLERGGLDQDDDLVLIEFGDDPAAQPLRLPDDARTVPGSDS